MNDQRRAFDEGEKLVGNFGKARLVLEEVFTNAVDGEGIRRHLTFGIDVPALDDTGRQMVDEFDTGYFDQPMTQLRLKAGRLGIKDDFAQVGPLCRLLRAAAMPPLPLCTRVLEPF